MERFKYHAGGDPLALRRGAGHWAAPARIVTAGTKVGGIEPGWPRLVTGASHLLGAVRPPAWAAFLALGAALTAVYVIVGEEPLPASIIVGLSLAGAAAIGYGLARHGPASRLPWLLFAAAQLFWAVGWTLWHIRLLTTGSVPASSSLVNLIFFAGYALIIAAFVVLLARLDPDGVSAVDVGTLFTALFVVAWAVLLKRYTETDLPAFGVVVQISYGVVGVAIVAAVIRLLMTSTKQQPAFWLLLVGGMLPVVSDSIWNPSALLGMYSPGSSADAGWVLFSVLIGAAALHPSMRGVYARRAQVERQLKLDRFLLLAAAALVAPMVMIINLFSGEFDYASVIVPLGGAAVISLLVLPRMALLLRETIRFAAQNQQLQELDKLKDDFVASVSHELRTPLTAIIGYLELVLDGEAGELRDEQRRFLTIVERNSNRLLHLVGDLLFVSNVQANALALDSEEVDLPALVEESAQSARPLADSKEIELVVVAGQMPPYRGDPVRLAQMLDNLVVNAVKFTPLGGRVTVALSLRGRQARVEVSDTGMGISPDELERLFERFFRTSSATESATQGTGLGLSIVKAIAEAHGGTVEVESQVGTGTTFCVALPLDAAVEPTRELAAMTA